MIRRPTEPPNATRLSFFFSHCQAFPIFLQACVCFFFFLFFFFFIFYYHCNLRIPEEMLTTYQRKWVKNVRESAKMKRKSWRTSNKKQKEIDGNKGKNWQLDLSVRLLVFVGVEKEGVWFEWIVLNTEARTIGMHGNSKRKRKRRIETRPAHKTVGVCW